MSDDRVELDKNTLQKLFDAAGMEVPEDLNSDMINDAISKIKSDFANVKKDAMTDGKIAQSNDYLKGGEEQRRPRTVLIIDDLGVIVYQLELLFKKMGFEVTTTNRVSDCIAKFKKKDFGYVVMDLFVPTEKEGFLLLDELKKLVLLCKLDTKIVVMTASSKNEYKANCKNRGADYYIEKSQGWQNELINYCK